MTKVKNPRKIKFLLPNEYYFLFYNDSNKEPVLAKFVKVSSKGYNFIVNETGLYFSKKNYYPSKQIIENVKISENKLEDESLVPIHVNNNLCCVLVSESKLVGALPYMTKKLDGHTQFMLTTCGRISFIFQNIESMLANNIKVHEFEIDNKYYKQLQNLVKSYNDELMNSFRNEF